MYASQLLNLETAIAIHLTLTFQVTHICSDKSSGKPDAVHRETNCS